MERRDKEVNMGSKMMENDTLRQIIRDRVHNLAK